MAVKNADVETVKNLIELGVSVNIINNSPLRIAAEYGHLNIVQLLIDRGADIFANNDAPLIASAMFGHLDVVQFLVGQSLYNQNSLKTALIYSTLHGCQEVTQLLLDSGTTIYHYLVPILARSNHVKIIKIVQLLLNYGADIHAENENALFNAMTADSVEMVQLLLSRGADMRRLYDKSFDLQVLQRLFIQGAFVSLEESLLTMSDYHNCLWLKELALFAKQIKLFGLLHRHVHTLEEFCRKKIIYSRTLPEKIETLSLNHCVNLVNNIICIVQSQETEQ
jgi:hypothetical protein